MMNFRCRNSSRTNLVMMSNLTARTGKTFLMILSRLKKPRFGEELREEVATDSWDRNGKKRALQNAIALCEGYNWDADGIRILSEIFERYGWNATRRAVERQLRLGLNASELKQAFVVREIWESLS